MNRNDFATTSTTRALAAALRFGALAIALLAAAAAPSGCGDSSSEPPAESTSDATTPSDAAANGAADGGDAAASDGSSSPTPVADSGRAPTAEEAAALESLLAEADALIEAAQFSLATKKLQSSQDDFIGIAGSDAIQQRITWLYTARREGPNVRFAIEQLTSDDIGTVMRVEQQIKNAGRLGHIMLAQGIRTMPEDQAAKAAQLLGEQDATIGASSIIDRLTKNPPEKPENAKLIAKALTRLAGSLPAEDVSKLAESLGDDPNFERRAFVAALGQVVRVQLDGDASRLNELAGQDDLDQKLSEYVALAWQQGGENPDLREWAAGVGAQFNVRVPGVHGRYYAGGELFGDALFERRDSELRFDGLEAFALPDDLTLGAFSASYEGAIKIDKAGEYAFIVWSDDGQRLSINDELVIDKWSERTPPQVARMTLQPGMHTFKLDYRQTSGPATLTVRFSGPGIDKALLDMTYLRTLPWQGMNITP